MRVPYWLNFLASRRTGPRLARPAATLRGRSFRPTFEALEDRTVPSFSPAVNYPVGDYSPAVVTADFDGDGRADVATANYGSSTVSVLSGNADGTFQPALTSATGTTPLSAAGGDFIADG